MLPARQQTPSIFETRVENGALFRQVIWTCTLRVHGVRWGCAAGRGAVPVGSGAGAGRLLVGLGLLSVAEAHTKGYTNGNPEQLLRLWIFEKFGDGVP